MAKKRSKDWTLVHGGGSPGGRYVEVGNIGVLDIRRGFAENDIDGPMFFVVTHWTVGHARGPITTKEFPTMKEAIAYAQPTLIAMRLAWPG